MARKGTHRKVEAPRPLSAKDRRRAEAPGRHDQGMGRAGLPGGPKSAGGKGGRVQGGMRGGDRGGWRSGGGKPSPKKAIGVRRPVR